MSLSLPTWSSTFPPSLPRDSTKPWQRNLLFLCLTYWKQQKGVVQNFRSEVTGTVSAWKTAQKLIRTQTTSLFLEQGSWDCQSFPGPHLRWLTSQSCPRDWCGTHQLHLDNWEMKVQSYYWTVQTLVRHKRLLDFVCCRDGERKKSMSSNQHHPYWSVFQLCCLQNLYPD